MRKFFLVVTALALVAAFTVPAAAQEEERSVSFYGNLRMNTFWIMADKEYVNAFEVPGAVDDDDDLFWEFDTGNSRFGVLFKSGDITANVEIRPNNGSYFRQWNATWNFGAGTLVLGQTWDPAFTSIFGCCFDGGPAGGYGGQNSRLRQPQIGVWFPVGTGTFKFAAMQPTTGATVDGPITSTGEDFTIPTLSFSIDQKWGGLYIKGFGSYNTYDEDDQIANKDWSVDSYVLGIQPSYAFGPFEINFLGWMGQNTAGYQVSSRNPYGALYVAASDSIEDVDSYGLALTATFKLNDMISFEGGYAMSEDERDFDQR
jgi:hypothetical protein